jgi:predicted metal-dependent hydrolase
MHKEAMKQKERIRLQKIEDNEYTVVFRKVKRSLSIRVHLKGPGKILVTGPHFVSYRAMEIFFESKVPWIAKEAPLVMKDTWTLQLPKEEYQKIRAQARQTAEQKVSQWNLRLPFSFTGITIRNQKSRWGSCSSSGRLSFHARIYELPEDLQDYLVVHELCHLSVMDHSPRFWALIERMLPEARQLDKALKNFGKESILKADNR